ncbi:MAG: hypothetical protein RIE24_06545 [Silicimonas sp.]
MALLNLLPGVERLIPLLLFALYLLTAVRICRYSSWVRAGAPNPFLPRSLEVALVRIDGHSRRVA